MHSAIVTIRIPESLGSQRWLAFMASVDGLQDQQPNHLHKQKGVARLAENVWQVSFRENPGALARLVSCAVQHRLHYGILQLDAAPQWLPVEFDPKAI
jgi:hypothetical protein